MKLFIAGCARSGTTLTRDLMHCFADTFVYDRLQDIYAEHDSATNFEADACFLQAIDVPQTHAVVKRTFNCWQTLHLLPQEIGLIYCVRHPFDVLTSVHPNWPDRYHVTPKRWLCEFLALQLLIAAQPERTIAFVRYENLIAAPNQTGRKIAHTLGPTLAHDFASNPLGIAFHNRSIARWKTDSLARSHLGALSSNMRENISRFCRMFRYGELHISGILETREATRKRRNPSNFADTRKERPA
jgi:hypothetical protein